MNHRFVFALESWHHHDTYRAVRDRLRLLRPELRMTLLDLRPLCTTAGGPLPQGWDEIIEASPAWLGPLRPTRRPRWNMLANGAGLAYRRLVRTYESMLLSRGTAGLLLMKDHHTLNLALVMAARRARVKSVYLQEGPYAYVGRSSATQLAVRLARQAQAAFERLAGLPALPGDGLAPVDVLAVTSASYRQRFRQAGALADRIEVVGVPRYDSLPVTAAKIAASRRPQGGRTRLLYVHQPMSADAKVRPEAMHQAERVIAEAFSQLQARNLATAWVRPHPRSTADEVSRLHQLFGEVATVETAGGSKPFTEALADFDLLVGFYSNGLLEAMACGLPAVVMALPPESFRDRNEWQRTQLTLEAGALPMACAADLQTLVASGVPVLEPARLDAEMGPLDGGSTERMAKLLASL